jgi:hypothetical protein
LHVVAFWHERSADSFEWVKEADLKECAIVLAASQRGQAERKDPWYTCQMIKKREPLPLVVVEI